LADLTGVDATGDVNGALHHHPVKSSEGTVHCDLGVGWFSDQRRPDGINPMDLRRCGYTTGRAAPGARARGTVRTVTMIYYVANPAWCPGDGGETALYDRASQPLNQPSASISPRNNSILVFANTPRSYHSFRRNLRHVRNSVILWLHSEGWAASHRWGSQNIHNWAGGKELTFSAPDQSRACS
jgi:hypothetical protein